MDDSAGDTGPTDSAKLADSAGVMGPVDSADDQDSAEEESAGVHYLAAGDEPDDCCRRFGRCCWPGTWRRLYRCGRLSRSTGLGSWGLSKGRRACCPGYPSRDYSSCSFHTRPARTRHYHGLGCQQFDFPVPFETDQPDRLTWLYVNHDLNATWDGHGYSSSRHPVQAHCSDTHVQSLACRWLRAKILKTLSSAISWTSSGHWATKAPMSPSAGCQAIVALRVTRYWTS